MYGVLSHSHRDRKDMTGFTDFSLIGAPQKSPALQRTFSKDIDIILM